MEYQICFIKILELSGGSLLRWICRRLLYMFAQNKIKIQPCPVAEQLQPKLLQFTTNQENVLEMNKQAKILEKTVRFFNQSLTT